jgi:hypothetical protein
MPLEKYIKVPVIKRKQKPKNVPVNFKLFWCLTQIIDEWKPHYQNLELNTEPPWVYDHVWKSRPKTDSMQMLKDINLNILHVSFSFLINWIWKFQSRPVNKRNCIFAAARSLRECSFLVISERAARRLRPLPANNESASTLSFICKA